MRRALFPSEVAASTPIGLSVPRFPAPHTLAAFSIRPRIHFGRLPRLDFHTLPATTVRRSAAPIPSGQTGLDASRQAPRPLEFICRIGWRFCTMHDQESNLTVWGLKPRCTSKDDRHPILCGIGFLTLPTAKAGGFSVQRPLHRSGVLHSLPERIGSGVSRPTVCLG